MRSSNSAAPVIKAGPRVHPGVVAAFCFLALALQVFLPVYLPLAGSFDIPLLAVVYFSLLSKNVLRGLLIGLLVGLAQDGLTHGPIGLFGITKSVTGYAAAAVSLVIEVRYPGARGVLAASFYLAHQVFYWVIESALLGGRGGLDPAETLILAATHAGMALLAFRALDGVRTTA